MGGTDRMRLAAHKAGPARVKDVAHGAKQTQEDPDRAPAPTLTERGLKSMEGKQETKSGVDLSECYIFSNNGRPTTITNPRTDHQVPLNHWTPSNQSVEDIVTQVTEKVAGDLFHAYFGEQPSKATKVGLMSKKLGKLQKSLEDMANASASAPNGERGPAPDMESTGRKESAPTPADATSARLEAAASKLEAVTTILQDLLGTKETNMKEESTRPGFSVFLPAKEVVPARVPRGTPGTTSVVVTRLEATAAHEVQEQITKRQRAEEKEEEIGQELKRARMAVESLEKTGEEAARLTNELGKAQAEAARLRQEKSDLLYEIRDLREAQPPAQDDTSDLQAKLELQEAELTGQKEASEKFKAALQAERASYIRLKAEYDRLCGDMDRATKQKNEARYSADAWRRKAIELGAPPDGSQDILKKGIAWGTDEANNPAKGPPPGMTPQDPGPPPEV